MMTCTACATTIDKCVCSDRDQSLHDMAFDPKATFLAFKWCRLCDKHYARCRCVQPDFYIISAGKEVPVPADGMRNAAGGRTIPDLKHR